MDTAPEYPPRNAKKLSGQQKAALLKKMAEGASNEEITTWMMLEFGFSISSNAIYHHRRSVKLRPEYRDFVVEMIQTGYANRAKQIEHVKFMLTRLASIMHGNAPASDAHERMPLSQWLSAGSAFLAYAFALNRLLEPFIEAENRALDQMREQLIGMRKAQAGREKLDPQLLVCMLDDFLAENGLITEDERAQLLLPPSEEEVARLRAEAEVRKRQREEEYDSGGQ